MQIELTSPSCLLLGLGWLDGQLCQVGITLQYPQVQLLARDAAALSITGARADLAHRQAAHYYAKREAPPPLSPVWERGGEGRSAEVEIELAIPQFMGLGSAAMLGLSVARALSAVHGLPSSSTAELARAAGLSEDQALESQAFAQGGLLAVGADGTLLRRQPIAHQDEADDWVFVLVLPRPPAGTPETLEADRRAALLAAGSHLGAEITAVVEAELWPAIERDDIDSFARALARLDALNRAALERAGQLPALSADDQAVLKLMRQHGALACGRALAGLGLYGLIRGGGPSRALRCALAEQLGLFGGTVTAALCDNAGSTIQ